VADPDTGQISGTLYDPNGEGVSLDSDPNATAGVKTNLKYVAIKGEQRSEVFSKTFAVDLLAPKMSVDVAPGTYDAPQDATFTTSERAKVYHTKDGSNPDPRQGDNPVAKSFVYDPAPEAQNEGNVIKVDRSQKIRAIAVDLDAANNDAEINWSQPKAFKYSISSLAKVGPINPQNGFPFWHEDRNGTRLDMCLNPIAAPEPGGGHCATPFEMPPDWQPGDGVSFPNKFPGEAFWFTGESGMDTSDKGSADLVMAIEAAFVNEEPKASDRMVFGRVRIRVDDLVAGETYKVTHPYGTDTFVAQPVKPGSTVGEINTTEDIGCMIPSEEDPCDYNDARFSRVGPFLTKDMERAPNQSPEPTGLDGSRYLADPATDEDIAKGSPIPDPNHPSGFQNYFKVEGPDIGTPGRNMIQTDLFSIAGKYSEFQAAASKVSGFYNTPQEVTLGASEENANIFYTLDGSEPTTGGTQYSGPIAIDAMNQETTLKFIAVNPATGEQSKVFTETYTLDDTAPNVNPSVDPGAYNAAQNVALSSNEDGAKVYFTTEGSAPTDKSTLYESPIRVDSATTIKAIAIDRAGNASEVASFDYDVQIPDTTLDLDVNRNVLTFGQAAILSGKITASDPNSSVSDKRLVVEEKSAGSDEWTRARGGTTADDGSFRLGVRPDLNTAYRIQFEGDDALRTSTSRDVQVNVRTKVILGLSTDALLQGRRVVISGSVAPDHTGSVRLVIRRGTQVVARPTVRLRDSNYRYAYQPRVAGNYNARAVFAGHNDHLVGRSSLDRFQVNPRR
jgi:hypothetical protein